MTNCPHCEHEPIVSTNSHVGHYVMCNNNDCENWELFSGKIKEDVVDRWEKYCLNPAIKKRA